MEKESHMEDAFEAGPGGSSGLDVPEECLCEEMRPVPWSPASMISLVEEYPIDNRLRV
jgi:hypothetical protein